ncbi:MAG: EAL domain-containing protein [Gammaproteobacteria bacterium]|nr:EAL domain-containing protein [Gammaproteobacteria bacterium]
MKLANLSIAGVVGAGAGLLVLVVVALQSLDHVRVKQAEVADLLTLQNEINEFSVASDNLLLFGADPSLWQAYQEDARAIQDRLRRLSGDHPEAAKAVRHMSLIIDEVAQAREAPLAAAPPGEAADGGPLGLGARSRVIMNQVAGHGIALDTVLNVALRERQQLIAREANWIAGAFAGSTLLFGILCMGGFVLIYRRISGPTREIAEKMARIRGGDLAARAEVSGSDEFADLANEFNRLIDYRQAVDEQLRTQQLELRSREAMLADSQRMARIGSWRLQLAEGKLEWSEETYRIVGVSPGSLEPTPDAFLEFVHPEDRQRLLDARKGILQGRPGHDLEFRIVRPDGEVRHVHQKAEPQTRESSGRVESYAGTIQDITDRKRDEERLNQYRQLIEASDDAFAIADAQYRYVLVNQAYARWFDVDRSHIEGKELSSILGEEYFQGEVKPALARALAGEVQVFETRRSHPDAGMRELLIRYYPIHAPDGAVHQVGAVITDVTELKQIENELKEQSRLVSIAGLTARIGGWSVDLASGRVSWSDVVAEIHGMPAGYSPSLDEGMAFYVPECRDRIERLFADCAEKGQSYDEEFEITAADGERRWVRIVGEPVRNGRGDIVRVQGAFQDVSVRKAAEQEKDRLEERTRSILESITDAFYTLDNEWRFRYVNTACEAIIERSRKELIGRSIWEAFPDAVGSKVEKEYRRVVTEQTTASLEVFYHPLGKWFDIRAYPTDDGLAVYFQDSTQRHEMMDRLREQEETLRASRDDLEQVLQTRQALINSLPAHIALLDGDGRILDVNEQWRHFGVENSLTDPECGIGSNYIAICDGATGDCAEGAQEAADGLRKVLSGVRESFSLEYPCHSPATQRWFRVMANRLAFREGGDSSHGAVVMHVDITERKLAEQELSRLAYQDHLTGLPSRNGFTQLVAERIESMGWNAEEVVVALNVRGLHDINEAHGFAAGDELLVQVGQRLERCAGSGAIVGRAGGDDFIVFLPGGRSDAGGGLLDELYEVFETPFALQEASIEAGARFGYTVLGNGRRDVTDLLREASLALSHTRHEVSGYAWAAYTSKLDEEARERIRINRELHKALERSEFELHFQPKVELDSGNLVSCEALLRWRHPERGLQTPGTFIRNAEQSQLIGPIGNWVVHEACRCLKAWQKDGLHVVRVAINVSLVQFMIGDFTKIVRDALHEHGVAASSISLEITESVFEQQSEELLAHMNALRDLGVHLSLDDFGTGYSSLLYLQRYPFDEIKIDRGFVQNVLDDAYSRHIVATVMGVAGAIGADVVAEGVETREVRDALLGLGCRLGQGYYYSMPLESEDFRWLLAKRSALPLSGVGS